MRQPPCCLVLALATIWTGCQSCENGDIRLADGFDDHSGRVEFCHEAEWGTVCDDHWDENDATVVCRQLGLPTDNVSHLWSFGGGVGAIFLDNVACSGSEERLDECSHRGYGVHDCFVSHREDAGVICATNSNPKQSLKSLLPRVLVPIKRQRTEVVFLLEIFSLLKVSLTRETPHTSDQITDVSECKLVTTSSGEDILQEPISRTCLQRYGHCVPYRRNEPESICDEFYRSEVDYIYVPHTRVNGQYSHLMREFIYSARKILSSLGNCSLPIRQVFCHHYLTPCGTSAQFEPPKPTCRETCLEVQEKCLDEWEVLEGMYKYHSSILEDEGVYFIDCDNLGRDLRPLPSKCTDYELTFSVLSSPILYTTAGDSNTNNTVKITLFCNVVALALLLLAIIVTISVIIARIKMKRREKILSDIPQTSSENITLERNENEEPMDFMDLPNKLAEGALLIPRHTIHIDNILGQGEFGVVYRGTVNGWRGTCMETVAVKTLKVFSELEQNRLIEESLVMMKFDHLNVMKLIGVSPYKRVSLYIVMPYMIHGSLLSYLRMNRANLNILTNDNPDLVNDVCQKLWSMCLQICKGMEYLASLHFVHRDLAARNCMIDDKFVIKVSDFGLTEDIYSRNYFRQFKALEDEDYEADAPVRLPIKWMALESLNDGVFTEKTDVWSFGVTCWEVFSLGKNPYPGLGPRSVLNYLERGERLEKPKNESCSHDIYSVVKNCWKEMPEDRPSFSKLIPIISTSLEKMAGYLKLNKPF